MSGRSRWVGGALSSMIVAQLACGAYFTVSAARSQGKLSTTFLFVGRLKCISSTTIAGHKPGSIQDLRLRTD